MKQYGINFEDGMTYDGNWTRIKRVMRKAQAGEPITIGFLGGSITQGSLSSTPKTCYAYLVYSWWVENFPQAKVTYLNAGIGATTSQFAVARVEEDLLSYHPDFTTIEFSVNDENSEFFKETYEGLVRKILGHEHGPAPLIIHNVFYNSGYNAQEQHESIGRHYGVPCVSMKTCVYPKIADGSIQNREITPDDLHPNDDGHRILADLVIFMLERIYQSFLQDERVDYDMYVTKDSLPDSITANAYEKSKRWRNHNCEPKLDGFVADHEVQNHITEIFRNGWISEKAGDRITFFVEGSNLAVQYRKSVKHPACKALAIVDDDVEHAVILDGNFDETWGDCLFLQTLLYHGQDKLHKVEIQTTSGEAGCDVPFYLVSVIS